MKVKVVMTFQKLRSSFKKGDMQYNFIRKTGRNLLTVVPHICNTPLAELRQSFSTDDASLTVDIWLGMKTNLSLL